MSRSSAASASHRIADLAVLLTLAAFVLLYCIDAVQASTNVLNLILVLPLSIVVLGLCLAQFVLTATRRRSAPDAQPATGGAADDAPAARTLGVAGLFALYVLTLPWLGFDLGTALFLAAFLWQQGERRWLWLVGYSIAFALTLAFAFSRLLPYDMPLRLLGGA